MTLIIFKYCLPALLGYTLFVGIAGRLNPFTKPDQPTERPSWLLGVWTGLTVSAVLGLGLHLAYGMSPQNAEALLKPGLWAIAGLLVPGFIAYFVYRNNVKNILATTNKPTFNWILESENMEFATELDLQVAQDHILDRGLEPHILDGLDIPDAEKEVAESFLPSVSTDQLDTENLADAINDSDSDTHTWLPEIPASDDSLLYNVDVELELMSDSEIESESESEADTILFDTRAELLSEHTIDQINPEDEPLSEPPANEPELAEMQSLLRNEQALREETEKHLRITRKALSTIEAETRHYETRKADEVIRLEEKLSENIRTQSALEAQSTREKTRRVTVETNIVTLKQDLVKAKQEVRRSIAARAKALSTANKSIAFARQNVQIRGRLESEISDMQATLKNRQTTISSLIRALEKEKRRTQDEVAAMAKQLVLHEKQVKARRSLEEVAKSVEMKLSSRLVKKIAKARPLISD